MMSKSEIHIVKDEISMVVEAKGSLEDITKMFSQAIYDCSDKYGIRVNTLCAIITEFAKAKEQISIMEANIRSGKIIETEALALLNAYLNKRLKEFDEFLDKENKRGVSNDGD